MNRLRLNVKEAHIPCDNISYCHKEQGCASSAFELNEITANIKLKLPTSLSAVQISLELYDDALKRVISVIDGEWINREYALDEYTFDIQLSSLSRGLYFYRFKILSPLGNTYSHKCGNDVFFNSERDTYGMLQLTVCDFEYPEPSDIYGGVIYHIFVDRFNRGGDVKIPEYLCLVNGKWERIPEYPEYPGARLKNNTIYGGTLIGITEKLDYISSLGVIAIYLSPIFKSVSNHKYDTADYMTVDESLGGDEALEELIAACKEKGIRLILDGVFNHTGADSIYFNKNSRFDSVGAYQSKTSEYFDWFDFKKYPDEYTCWWDIDILPRINPDKPACRAYFTGNNGVIAKYRNMGVYGFRLDVADELSDDFISDIKSKSALGGESILYGEVWEDASNKIAYDTRKQYYLGNELDGVMNYPLRKGIIDYVKNRDTSSLRYALCEVMRNAPDRIMHAQMNLLGTHDTERILTVFGGESSTGKTNDYLVDKKMTRDEYSLAVRRLCAAYTVIATLPGVPTVFYGDEAGLEGYHDPFNRMPYPWGDECDELLSHYKRIGKIRRSNSVYKCGAFKIHAITDKILIFSRQAKECRYFTVMNNSDKEIEISFGKNKATSILGGFKLAPISAGIYRTRGAEEIEISEAEI